MENSDYRNCFDFFLSILINGYYSKTEYYPGSCPYVDDSSNPTIKMLCSFQLTHQIKHQKNTQFMMLKVMLSEKAMARNGHCHLATPSHQEIKSSFSYIATYFCYISLPRIS